MKKIFLILTIIISFIYSTKAADIMYVGGFVEDKNNTPNIEQANIYIYINDIKEPILSDVNKGGLQKSDVDNYYYFNFDIRPNLLENNINIGDKIKLVIYLDDKPELGLLNAKLFTKTIELTEENLSDLNVDFGTFTLDSIKEPILEENTNDALIFSVEKKDNSDNSVVLVDNDNKILKEYKIDDDNKIKIEKKDLGDRSYKVVHKVSEGNYSTSVTNRDALKINKDSSVKEYDKEYKKRYFGENNSNFWSKNTLIYISLIVILLVCYILFIKFFKNGKIAQIKK